MGPSAHHCSPKGRAPIHSSVKTSTWCLHQGRWKLQSRQQTDLSSRRFATQKSRIRDMSARGYALYCVRPQLSFQRLARPCNMARTTVWPSRPPRRGENYTVYVIYPIIGRSRLDCSIYRSLISEMKKKQRSEHKVRCAN